MPRPRQAQGRPGTIVIPENWGANHALVVGKTLASTVQIGVAGGSPQWVEGQGQTVTAPVGAVYAGPASLGAVSDTDRALTVVEDPVKTRVYDVTLDRSRTGVDAIAVGHTIFVTACDDAALTGKQLKVAAIERGTRRFSRVLLATLID